MKVVAGAAMVPKIFKLQGITGEVKAIVEAPDGTRAEIPVDVKIYEDEDFFKSIEEFKETIKEKE